MLVKRWQLRKAFKRLFAVMMILVIFLSIRNLVQLFNQDSRSLNGFVFTVNSKPDPVCRLIELDSNDLMQLNNDSAWKPIQCENAQDTPELDRLLPHSVYLDNLNVRIEAAENVTGFTCDLIQLSRYTEWKSLRVDPILNIRHGHKISNSDQTNYQYEVICRNNDKERKFLLCGSPPVKLEQGKSPPSSNLYNVILISLDSVSRAQLTNLMPKTWAFVQERASAFMHKASIIGDGTTAPFLALLTGRFEQELPESRKQFISSAKVVDKNGFTVVDKFPWIWNLFKEQHGYSTMYMEDMPDYGTFQYRLVGFGSKQAPVDNYGRTCFLASKEVAVGCQYSKPNWEIVLNATKEFHKVHATKPRFSVSHLVQPWHDSSEGIVELIDRPMEQFLREATQEHRQNIVIFFSDHGPRSSEARQTINGKFRERMPILSLFFPRSWENRNLEALANLKKNQNALVTMFDVHATLLEFLESIPRNHALSTQKTFFNTSHGLSLFHQIPLTRTCQAASIEPQWCNCAKKYTLGKNFGPNLNEWPESVYKLADQAVMAINQELKQFNKSKQSCLLSLSVRRIELAQILILQKEMALFDKSKDLHGQVPNFAPNANGFQGIIMSLLFKTEGNFSIELTVPLAGDEINLQTSKFLVATDGHDISVYKHLKRLDKYESQVHSCLKSNDVPNLRMYCLCL